MKFTTCLKSLMALFISIFSIISCLGQNAEYLQAENSRLISEQNKQELANIMQAYKKVLTNEIKYFDTRARESIFFRDYCDNNNITATEIRFTVIDLDGNSVPEIVLEHNPGVLIVLRFENGKIYGFLFDYRGMNGLKKDGSFNWSNSAFNSGIGRRTFSGTNTNIVNLAEYSSGPDDNNVIYYINKIKVTEREFSTFQAAQDKKEDVEWYMFTRENVNNLK